MPRPSFRIACCLCGNAISSASDVYALDEEWQRRFPRMVGTLACQRCAVSDNYWECRTRSGQLVEGHRPAAALLSDAECFDSWHHIAAHGTHVAMVWFRPWSGLLQGAEEYMRYTARRPGVEARKLQDVFDQWDVRGTNSPRL